MLADRIEPVYGLDDQGRFLLFDGPLAFRGEDGSASTFPGQIELQLGLTPALRMYCMDSRVANALFFNSDLAEPAFTVVEGADLTPPPASAVSKRDCRACAEFRPSPMQAGDLRSAAQFVFHVGGPLELMGSVRNLDDGGRQVQVDFALPGWSLTISPHHSDAEENADFAVVIRAIPTSRTISDSDVQSLRRRLFLLLSFLANREIGISPICGLGEDGHVVWAEWGTPRMVASRPGIKWCPDPLVADALPLLAEGWGALVEDEALEVIADRAIGLSLVANAREVLDVRIPIACAGLELLAWTILQRESLDVEGREQSDLSAAEMLRRSLQWAEIPTDIPEHFDHLLDRRERRAREGQKDWEGSEIIFDIRNRLMHPPRKLDDPEWPEGGELLEAWQLATWYLDLILLRLLSYNDEYWSRLRLNRYDADLEAVPWRAPRTGP